MPLVGWADHLIQRKLGVCAKEGSSVAEHDAEQMKCASFRTIPWHEMKKETAQIYTYEIMTPVELTR